MTFGHDSHSKYQPTDQTNVLFVDGFHKHKCVAHLSTFDPYCMTILSRVFLYHTFHKWTVTACAVIRKVLRSTDKPQWMTWIQSIHTSFLIKTSPFHKIVNESGPVNQEQILAPTNNYHYIPLGLESQYLKLAVYNGTCRVLQQSQLLLENRTWF